MPLTRGEGGEPSLPTLSGPDDSPKEYLASKIKDALKYMDEGEDNRGLCSQSFEYIAFETETYDIYPVFWGRKFCDNNSVGIYYIDENGNPQKLIPDEDAEGFWNDRDSKITAVFQNGTTKPISVGEYPINELQTIDGRNGGDWDKVVPLTDNGSPLSKFIMPHYILTVPKGMKWGMYLTTNKVQGDVYKCENCGNETTDKPENWNDSNKTGRCLNCSSYHPNFHGGYYDNRSFEIIHPRVTWYSNANLNPNKEKAAATFHLNGNTYCCFEDAPHECTNHEGTGNCSTCGYGHYDTDFNDIVFYISPRPYETTYQAIKYRVMCEDLGGTFDWDFNDVVYDVIYQEDEKLEKNATVTIVLQAVGGTLPVRMYYDNVECKGTNGKAELHEIANNQQKDPFTKLYEPVNVGENNHPEAQKVVKTINLNQPRVTNMDIRDYVKYVTIRVQQDPEDDTTTTQVSFPVAPKDQGSAVPQCFMTSTKTDWADELQPITEKYSHFEGWVMQHNSNEDWWSEGLGGTEPNVVVKEQ